MRKGTKVNENNMMAVMGRINKFLSCPAKIVEDGVETIIDATCGVNYFRKMVEERWKTNSLVSKADEVFAKNSLLSIYDNGTWGVLPIEAGSRVFISGSQMIIERKCDVIPTCSATGRVVTIPFLDRNRTYVFNRISSEDVGDEVMRNRLRHVLSEISADEAYVEREDIPGENFREFRSIGFTLNSLIAGVIEEADISQDVCHADLDLSDVCLKEFSWLSDVAKDEIIVGLTIDVAANRNEPDFHSMKLVFNNREHERTTSLLFAIITYCDISLDGNDEEVGDVSGYSDDFDYDFDEDDFADEEEA